MPPSAAPSPDLASPPEHLAGRRNLLQLIELRWLAVAGQLGTILMVHYVLEVPLPVGDMLSLLAVLTAFNLVSILRARLAPRVTDLELFCGLLVDVLLLTGQLFHAGGIANPFIFIYLLQVAVASILLPQAYTWAVVVAAGTALGALTQWYLPLQLGGLTSLPLSADYAGGLLVCFLLDAGLLVVFISRINRNLRERDAALASLRQRAAEQEHIVRMGLLASGAAHELGTPLATLSVILGDWSHMKPFTADPDLGEELAEMQRQIERCKAIVSGILTSAGRTRADAPKSTTLHAFLDETVQTWRSTRPNAGLRYERLDLPDIPLIADTALAQMIGNLLDNAVEAAPASAPALEARCDGVTLLLRVRDQGPGFAPAMLQRLGTPYQSDKGKPGRGLGLFLAVNVARTLGGRLRAQNHPTGGAEVVIELPVSALLPTRPAP